MIHSPCMPSFSAVGLAEILCRNSNTRKKVFHHKFILKCIWKLQTSEWFTEQMKCLGHSRTTKEMIKTLCYPNAAIHDTSSALTGSVRFLSLWERLSIDSLCCCIIVIPPVSYLLYFLEEDFSHVAVLRQPGVNFLIVWITSWHQITLNVFRGKAGIWLEGHLHIYILHCVFEGHFKAASTLVAMPTATRETYKHRHM